MKPLVTRHLSLVTALAALAAVAAADPAFAAPSAPGTVGAAFSTVFSRIAAEERSFGPAYADATKRDDPAGMAAICAKRAALFRTLSETAGLTEGGRAALVRLSDVQSFRGAFLRELAAAPAAEREAAAKKIAPLLRATDALAARNAASILHEAREVGAGETAVCAAPVFADGVLALLGDIPQPLPNLAMVQDEKLWSDLAHLGTAVVILFPPPYAVRDTPEAKAVTAAVAALARTESDAASALSAAVSGPRPDPAAAARAVKAEIDALRKIPLAGCPAPFRKAFVDFGRGRVGLASALQSAAASKNPAAAAFLLEDLKVRNDRQVADKAAVVREARAAGADTAPLRDVWIDAFAHAALVPPRPSRAAAAGSPAQRYADGLAALVSDFAAASERAPAGIGGAKARLAAFQTLYAGVRQLDPSCLPKDGTSPHADLVTALRQIGMAMRRLENESAKGPAAFLAALQASQGELGKLDRQFETALERLKDSLRRAGADVSALDRLK